MCRLLFIIYWGFAARCLGWRCVWLHCGVPGVVCFSPPQRSECRIDISSTQCHFRLAHAGSSNMHVCTYSACVHASSSASASCDGPIIRSQFHAWNLVNSTAVIRNCISARRSSQRIYSFSLMNLSISLIILWMIFHWCTVGGVKYGVCMFTALLPWMCSWKCLLKFSLPAADFRGLDWTSSCFSPQTDWVWQPDRQNNSLVIVDQCCGGNGRHFWIKPQESGNPHEIIFSLESIFIFHIIFHYANYVSFTCTYFSGAMWGFIKCFFFLSPR